MGSAAPADRESYSYRQSTGLFELVTASAARAVTVASAAANYDANAGELVNCNTGGGAFTVTLPTAIGITGQQITVRKSSSDSNAVTVACTGGQTINGDTTLTIVGQYTSIDMVSDGAGWVIV